MRSLLLPRDRIWEALEELTAHIANGSVPPSAKGARTETKSVSTQTTARARLSDRLSVGSNLSQSSSDRLATPTTPEEAPARRRPPR